MDGSSEIERTGHMLHQMMREIRSSHIPQSTSLRARLKLLRPILRRVRQRSLVILHPSQIKNINVAAAERASSKPAGLGQRRARRAACYSYSVREADCPI